VTGAPPREEFEEFSSVALAHAVKHSGETLPAGTVGVIVHRHADGIGYEVEFDLPTFSVITLSARELARYP